MVNDKIVYSMKHHYIIPATNAQLISQLNAICVGSIHGTENFEYGGGSDGSSDEMKPF